MSTSGPPATVAYYYYHYYKQAALLQTLQNCLLERSTATTGFVFFFCCYYHPHRHYYYHHLKYKLPQNLARRVSPVFFQERLLRCYCCCCNARFACITHIVARRLEGSRPPQWRIIKRLFGSVGRTDGPPRLRPSDTAAQRSASRRKLCPAISAEGAGNAFGVFSSPPHPPTPLHLLEPTLHTLVLCNKCPCTADNTDWAVFTTCPSPCGLHVQTPAV